MTENDAKIMDGNAFAKKLRREVQEQCAGFLKQTGRRPGLAVCLVGDHSASKIYVRKKAEACREVGLESFEHALPAKTTTQDLLRLMDELNQDSKVNGILVQLPLPSQINNEKILEAISPQKDVDGFHPKNVGLLSLGRPQFIPCTPLGIMKILQEYDVSLEGMNAVIVGRSNIVGKPMAQLLLKENATVTLCHSRTKNLAQILSQAELVVAAIGKAKFIHGKDLKPQVVVVDVGINRLDSGKLVGDVDFESAYEKARFITPVPGGVGPLTIACLLENTLKAAKMPAKV